MLVTFAEFAKIKGVSGPAVSQAVKSGRLSASIVHDGKRRFLEKGLAIQEWDTKTRRHPNAKIGTKQQREADAKVAEIKDDTPEEDIPRLDVSRAKREHFQARLAEIQVLEAEKKLIPAETVRKEAFALGRAVRESLRNLADRLASQIATETDKQIIHQMLVDEHHLALEQLVEKES